VKLLTSIKDNGTQSIFILQNPSADSGSLQHCVGANLLDITSKEQKSSN
jgi:hypothetical protein